MQEQQGRRAVVQHGSAAAVASNEKEAGGFRKTASVEYRKNGLSVA
jgi:hypothetical protein